MPPIPPMLATTGSLPIGSDWAYEFKWDGIRAIAEITSDHMRVYARKGAVITSAYPELGALATAVPDAVFDGEVVVLVDGKPSFEALAERMHVRDERRARLLAARYPVTYLIFDVLRLYGVDLLDRPFAERRATLERLTLDVPHVVVPPMFDDGPATTAAAEEHGLEGVVAKRLSALYKPGARSPDWIKVKRDHTIDVLVGGWRSEIRELSALLVGSARDDGRLDYHGRIGIGITVATERRLLSLLRPLLVDASPFADELPRDDARGARWVRPSVVVEVAYGNMTSDGRLRFPRFLRLRPDLFEPL